jgi:uncharacterized lipoprotein YajG
MKKLLFLIVILIIIAGCAKQPAVLQPHHKFPVLAMGDR